MNVILDFCYPVTFSDFLMNVSWPRCCIDVTFSVKLHRYIPLVQ